LPQAYETETAAPTALSAHSKAKPPADHRASTPRLLHLPVSFWGTLDPPGDNDEIEFDGQAGESINLDLAAKSIGSKAGVMLTFFDFNGALLASNNGFDGGDPLLNFRIPTTGRYRVRISEKMDAGSKEHYYRLSLGSFPVVVA